MGKRRRIERAGAIVSGTLALLMVVPAAQAHPDTRTCIDFTDELGTLQYVIADPTDSDPSNTGGDVTYVDPVTGFEVTIDLYLGAGGPEIDFFHASMPVRSVYVAGGDAGTHYSYPAGSFGDTGLHAPYNADAKHWFQIKHISFCWLPKASTVLTFKGANPGTTIRAGQSTTLFFEETNDGTVPLTLPMVTADNGCDPTYWSGDGNQNGVLDPGETMVFRCTIWPQDDVLITAIGSGVDPNGGIVTWCEQEPDLDATVSVHPRIVCDPDERVQVPIKVVNPSTKLELKGANPGTMVHAGGSTTLFFAETNDGNVPLTNPTVTANNGCNPAYVSGDTNTNGVLDPGETWIFSCTITPANDLVVTAIGSGVDPLGAIVTWCDEGPQALHHPPIICDPDEKVRVPIKVINASTKLTLNEASPGTTVHLGEQVTLFFAETNDGNVPLTNPTVTANNGCNPAYVSGDTNTNGVLDPGETWIFSCTITPANDLVVTAIGSGVDPLGAIVTWCDEGPQALHHPPIICDPDEKVRVPIKVINASTKLTLDASSGPTSIGPGDSVTLVFAETNDGNVPLTNPTVTANNGCNPAYVSGDTNTNGVLDPGETWLFACTLVDVQSSLVVTAIGSGVDPTGAIVTWCDGGDLSAQDHPRVICDPDEKVVVPIDVVFTGCTPGYWKNHPQAWIGYAPGQTVESVFDVPNAFGLDNDALITALDYPGGNKLDGAARILLRAAVASLLNAAHPDIDFPMTEGQIITAVNTALLGKRGQMLSLATALDNANNAGCPL